MKIRSMWLGVFMFILLAETNCEKVEHPLQRLRRQQPAAENSLLLTAVDEQRIIDVHNEIRRQESATNMRLMEWHSGLARAARGAVEACVWSRRSQSTIQGRLGEFEYVNENIHFTPANLSVAAIAREWGQEKDSFQYNTGLCNKICNHYTQIVWAASHSVGCAVQFCPIIENIPKTGGYLVACMYGPGGNVGRERPYTKGDNSCSECAGNFTYCWDGLCSKISKPVDLETTTKDSKSTTDVIIIAGASSLRTGLVGGYLVYLMLLM